MAIGHAAAELGRHAIVQWFATDALADDTGALASYDGIWIAPGSPYRSLKGALGAIVTARTTGMPLLGTCAGFQHIVLEFALNVLGHSCSAHAEYDPDADDLFVTGLSCSLVGQTFGVQLSSGSRAAAAYGGLVATERYYCNFGLNPDRRGELEAAGLAVTGTDADGKARIVELVGHPFFVGTLFVPQVSSELGQPHPLVSAFAQAGAERDPVSSETEPPGASSQ